jgi:hypothetical protein
MQTKTDEKIKSTATNDYSKIGDFDLSNYKEYPHVYVEYESDTDSETDPPSF